VKEKNMMRRVFLTALALTLAVMLPARADTPSGLPRDVKPKSDSTPPERLNEPATIAELANKQARMSALFSDFKASLLRMAVRMSNSSKPEDKARATILKTALDKANNDNVETSFEKLIVVIQTIKPDGTDTAEIARAIKDNEEITARIRALLAILQSDNRDEALKKALADSKARLKEIERLIREQRTARDRTELNRGTEAQRQKEQEKIRTDTENLAKKDPQGDFPGKKDIEKAIDNQGKAIDNLGKGNNDQAAGDQGDAVANLMRARDRELDNQNQLHREENERILASLQSRCERMLAMQIEVRNGTVTLDKAIQARTDARPDNADRARGNELQDRENDINREAREALRLIEAESSGISFQVVFQQLIGDMGNVSNRLGFADAGAVTVTIENDIIDTLKEMIDALKKARQTNEITDNIPPNDPGDPGPKPKKKLVEEVQELKMIRNLQVRVNNRTKVYGKEYRGEQAPSLETATTAQDRERAAMLKKEFKGLAESQDRIAEITRNFYKEKNK
jgi:hypothetical protein